MKIRVTLKDPDTMSDAVEEAVRREVKKLEGLSKEERDDLVEGRTSEQRSKIVDGWMPYGEYLEVEFDTEAGTATVIPASD